MALAALIALVIVSFSTAIKADDTFASNDSAESTPELFTAPQQVQDTLANGQAVAAEGDKADPVRSRALGERAVKLARAGLFLLPVDALLMKAVPRSGERKDFFTNTANTLGTPSILLPAIGGMYLFGGSQEKDTAKMTLAALVNAGVITMGLKELAGRGRPDSPTEAGEFQGLDKVKGDDSLSFPSGHTSAAFAVATVLANRHPKHRLLFYGLATAVGFARLRSSAHFPSDVLVGAGVGTYAGNQALSHRIGLLTWKIHF